MNYQKWNKDWLFFEDRDSFALIWSIPENAKKVDLPDDAMIRNKPKPESRSGGNTAFRDGGSYVYFKELYTDNPEKRYVLKFEGILGLTSVYVNGQRCVFHAYGYTAFYCPLNGFLKKGKNEIRISVRNDNMPNSRWYSGAGIYRDCYLITSSGSSYIAEDSLKATTLSLEGKKASVEIRADLHLESDCNLRCRIVGPDGKTVASSEETVPAGTEKYVWLAKIENADLWNEESPSLYHAELMLENDADSIRFGIRTVGISPEKGLLINGTGTKLRGACIHNDNGIIGAASFKDSEYRRIKKLKEAGFNAVRCSHNPSSQALLESCDELGVYVLEEAFDMWTRTKTDYDYANYFDFCHEEDLKSMVRGAYNHPSVILYSIGNEIPEIGTPLGKKLTREMSGIIKSMDTTRPVTAAVNGIFSVGDRMGEILKEVLGNDSDTDLSGNVNAFMGATQDHLPAILNSAPVTEVLEAVSENLDLVGYNYMAERYESDAVKYRNRVVFGSESYPPTIFYNWNIVRKTPNNIGDFTWSGYDYIGEAGIGIVGYAPGEGGFKSAYPCQLAYCGDIDINGFRRPQSYYREIVFGLRKDPYIAIRNPYHPVESAIQTPWSSGDYTHSYSFERLEGRPVHVAVYSPAGNVELYQNGKLVGRAESSLSGNLTAEFDILYREGTLTAKTAENGKAVGEDVLRSAGKSRLVIEKENNEHEEQLIFVNLRALDAEGIPDYRRCEKLEVSLTSETSFILASGSSNPREKYNYTENVLELFEGRGLVVLRKQAEHGTAVLHIRSDIEGNIDTKINY